ncbi:hypothetical protein EBZ80_01930 [bacterium]|nr:hypothetical protein [bacterium]
MQTHFLVLITGFDFSTNTGVLWGNETRLPIPGSRSLSYARRWDHSGYVVDENYGGSSLFRLDKDLVVRDAVMEPACRGAVFIERIESSVLIPCFGSDNVWVVDDRFVTDRIVPTCHRPHGIYAYRNKIYVPCRGDRDDGEIRIYDAGLAASTSIRVPTGPRHMIFVEDDFYVVTEFGHEVLWFSESHALLGRVDLEPDEDARGVTGAEIRYAASRAWILVSLRHESHHGWLIVLDHALNELHRVEVGTNPRFFDLCGDSVLVLNQDDRTATTISLDTLETDTSEDLGMCPQSFCAI